MAIKTAQDLFLNELRDTYHAEKQALKAYPKMIKQARHPELKAAFQEHMEQTRGQVDRLEQVFESLDVAKRAKRCEAMEGLLEEARSHMEEIEDAAVLDVAMIVSAQKVEHYEIAAYGSLVAMARQLGHDEAVPLLQETLEEEKATDEKLTAIAEGVANADAPAGEASSSGRAGKAKAAA
ncbi:MAG TPA: ferritin-like domain-containing protein [Geminicoccaceae bacterium]